jgi:organic radical activating enzyme
MPEKGAYSACCVAEEYTFDHKQFQSLGKDYFDLDARLLKRKNDLLENIKSHDCKQCWWLEEKNIISQRLHGKDYYSTPHWDFMYDKSRLHEAAVGRIELWLGSLCNMGCFMCHVDYSTILQRLYPVFWRNRFKDLQGQKYTAEAQEKFTQYMHEFCLRSIEGAINPRLQVAYLGGEPTIMKKTFDDALPFVEASRRNKAGTVFVVELTSNGSAPAPQMKKVYDMFDTYQKHKWKPKFKFSIDAVGPQSQVRWGGKIELVEKNYADMLSKPGVEFESWTVMSNLNLPYIDKLAEFNLRVFESAKNLDTKDVKIDFNVLEHPRWMLTNVLPPHLVKAQVTTAIEIYDHIAKTYGIDIDLRRLKSVMTAIEQCSDEERRKNLEIFFKESYYTENVYNMRFADYFPHVVPLRKYYDELCAGLKTPVGGREL